MARLSSMLLASLLVLGTANEADNSVCSGAAGESCADDSIQDQSSTALDIQALIQREQEARVQHGKRDLTGATQIFTAVLNKLATSSGKVRAEADLASSCRVFLGVIAEEQRDYQQCISYFEAAHKDSRALSAEFLRERPWPYSDAQVPQTARMFINSHSECLQRLGRDADARVLYQQAAAAGVFRNEWQCSLQSSPEAWSLRPQPWWELKGSRNGAVPLVKELRQNFKSIRKEALERLVKREIPDGVRMQLNQEVKANRTGTWLELITYKEGVEVESACAAVPTLCALIRPFLASLHTGNGAQVKLSHFIGATSAAPHCGALDTKLRLHVPIYLPKQFRKAEITVGGITKAWHVGRGMMFDDSFQHSVVFDADADAHRIVLIVDLWHPDVPHHLRAR